MPADVPTLADVRLRDPDGAPVALADHVADPLVVILMRYFGCLPCQQFVQAVDERRDELPDGAAVIAVAGSADYQAQWLRDTKGVAMPLLLDPDQQVRRVVEVGRLSVSDMLTPTGMKNYARAMFDGFRPQRPTRDADKAPGVAVLDASLDVQWVHEGATLGDYPEVDELLARIR